MAGARRRVTINARMPTRRRAIGPTVAMRIVRARLRGVVSVVVSTDSVGGVLLAEWTLSCVVVGVVLVVLVDGVKSPLFHITAMAGARNFLSTVIVTGVPSLVDGYLPGNCEQLRKSLVAMEYPLAMSAMSGRRGWNEYLGQHSTPVSPGPSHH